MGSSNTTSASARSFLFLQGPIGWFFSRLAARLSGDGHEVHRINLHGGDRLFWSRSGAVDFRGDRLEWPEFVSNYMDQWAVTDLILFGDCRPMHQDALRVAAERGVTSHVFEEGYLRPNWITMERGGVNANSSLPRDSRYYLEAAGTAMVSEPMDLIASSPLRRTLEGALYHAVMLLTRQSYRGYRTHRPWHPFLDLAHSFTRRFRDPSGRRRSRRLAQQLVIQNRPYFLFPLQLDSDAQIRYHSAFQRMQPAIEYVIRSFAHHAPREAILVITEHPMETGVVDFQSIVRGFASDAGIIDRVVFLSGGTPQYLLPLCEGLATVNSTLGFQALSCGAPVIALGAALYALKGLTFQEGLNKFWRHRTAPDAILFDAFRRVLVARTQINGGFYSGQGIAMAVDRAARRLQKSSASTTPAARRYPTNGVTDATVGAKA